MGYSLQGHKELDTTEMTSVSSVQLLSCAQLCDPMDHSTPGFAVHHKLPELVHTHVHRVSDAIQPSHLLLSPSPPTFYLSQHQDLSLIQFFTSGGPSIASDLSLIQ